MRSLRLLSLVFAFGLLTACGHLDPVGTQDGDDDEGVCSQETPEYCEGYIGSDS